MGLKISTSALWASHKERYCSRRSSHPANNGLFLRSLHRCHVDNRVVRSWMTIPSHKQKVLFSINPSLSGQQPIRARASLIAFLLIGLGQIKTWMRLRLSEDLGIEKIDRYRMLGKFSARSRYRPKIYHSIAINISRMGLPHASYAALSRKSIVRIRNKIA